VILGGKDTDTLGLGQRAGRTFFAKPIRGLIGGRTTGIQRVYIIVKYFNFLDLSEVK
jgi:hypothetical protein